MRALLLLFDPGTQFPENKKITLCNTKKVQKSSWNEPYSSSSSSLLLLSSHMACVLVVLEVLMAAVQSI